MGQKNIKILNLVQKFTKNSLFKGGTLTMEILSRILFKKLLKTSTKSSINLFKLFINHVSYLVKFNTKTKYLNSKSLFSFKSKFSFGLKLLIDKVLFYKQSSLLEHINNLLIIKKQVYSSVFNYKKLFLHYRW